ncbi:V-type ATP synthase subunit F [bacterium]|nr:V-type ATP synthase subunit F [bacterium]
MKFLLIGDKETATGFSLAGIECIIAESQAEIMEGLRQAKERSDIGICIITERLAEQVRPFLKKMVLRKKGRPIILEIPDRLGPLPGKQSVENIVLSALGVKV